MQAAQEALNSLDKKSIVELKSFNNPAKEVVDVSSAVILLQSPPNKLTKDISWSAAKKTMANVDRFLQGLLSFDKNNIPPNNVEAVKKQVAVCTVDPC